MAPLSDRGGDRGNADHLCPLCQWNALAILCTDVHQSQWHNFVEDTGKNCPNLVLTNYGATMASENKYQRQTLVLQWQVTHRTIPKYCTTVETQMHGNHAVT